MLTLVIPDCFHRVHHRGESTERNIFVGAHKNRLVARIANLLPQLAPYLIDVDGVVAQKDALIFIDRDHQPLLGDLASPSASSAR